MSDAPLPGATPGLALYDTTLRDGTQRQGVNLSVDDKVSLITRLVTAGARRVEAVSFVNPKRVPQMAGAEEVMEQLPRDAGASYIGLVLNRRGLDRALAAGVDEDAPAPLPPRGVPRLHHAGHRRACRRTPPREESLRDLPMQTSARAAPGLEQITAVI